jgi:hypothetical protein
MNNKEFKPIILPPLDKFQLNQMHDLSNAACRGELEDQIAKDIDEYCIQTYGDSTPRQHMGASVIGHNCERFIWYQFRWMFIETPKARMLRLWQRGHREEEVILELLRGIGFTIEHVDIDGEQIKIARSADGHFGGSCDSVGKFPERYGLANISFLLEMKTANIKNFTPIKNSGVVKTMPKHWSQSCVYGVKLQQEYLLYICASKNDDELDIEVLQLDWDLGNSEIAKADAIIKQYYPPRRLSESPSYFECKWCPALGICHLNETPKINCRSCKFAQPVADGKWHCHNYNNIIPTDFLIKGCPAWERIS